MTEDNFFIKDNERGKLIQKFHKYMQYIIHIKTWQGEITIFIGFKVVLDQITMVIHHAEQSTSKIPQDQGL